MAAIQNMQMEKASKSGLRLLASCQRWNRRSSAESRKRSTIGCMRASSGASSGEGGYRCCSVAAAARRRLRRPLPAPASLPSGSDSSSLALALPPLLLLPETAELPASPDWGVGSQGMSSMPSTISTTARSCCQCCCASSAARAVPERSAASRASEPAVPSSRHAAPRTLPPSSAGGRGTAMSAVHAGSSAAAPTTS